MKNLINKFQVYISIFVILILSFYSIKPLLANGFFPIHDNTQVARVFEMTKSLRDGMFPVRWVADLGYGYGYPIFNFYAPLAYYIGSIFSFLGFNALVSLKILMGIGIVFSAISMYFLAKEFWGELGGVLSGLLYVYVPYHALDIYVRGDVAEFWAYAFIPLVFYGIVKTFKTNQYRFIVIGSLAYAAVILSHNLTGLMVTPFVLIVLLLYCYIAFKKGNLFTIYYLLFTILTGLLLSAFYWLPAILEMNYTNIISQIGASANFRDHFVCLNQLWESQWGFGGSTPGCIDGISFRIGKLHIVLTLIVFIYSIFSSKKNKDEFKIILVSFLLLLVSIFLLLNISNFIWELLPFMSYFQYPWRFLIMAVFFSSFICGYFTKIVGNYLSSKKILNFMVTSLVIVFTVVYYAKLFSPQYISSLLNADYTSDVAIKWIASKISDEYLPKNFKKPNNQNEVISNKFYSEKEDVKVFNTKQKTQFVKAEVLAKNKTKLLVKTAYFPAWKIYIDERIVPYTITNKGMMVELNQGKHSLSVVFRQTMIEKIANTMSFIGLFLLILGIIRKRIYPMHEKTNS